MALTQASSRLIGQRILGYSKTFTQLTAPASTDHIHVPGALFHAFQVTVADIDTNVTLTIDGSNDGTSFGILPLSSTAVTNLAVTTNVATITANGTYILIVEVPTPFVRFTFAGETGGDSSATLDVIYEGRS